MKSKMKGLIGIIILGVSTILLGGAIYLSTSIGAQKSFSIALKEVYILKAINQLESIKQFLEYPINYSFSQAIYTVAKQSGYCDNPTNVPQEGGIYYWRINDNTYLPNYINSIEECLKKYLNEYADSLDIPKYKEVRIDENEGKISVITDSMMSKSIDTQTIDATIKANPNRITYFDKKVLSSFKTAKRLYIDSDIIETAVLNVIKNSCKTASSIYSCSECPKTPSQVHDGVCGVNWKSETESKIKKAINSLNGIYGDVRVEHDIKYIDVSYSGTCDHTYKYKKECYQKCENIDGEEKCTTVCYDVCDYCIASCKYTNQAKVKVLVKVYYPASDDKSLFYPIYDGGKRELSKIVLQFYVNETVYS